MTLRTALAPLLFALIAAPACMPETLEVGPGDVTKAGDGKFDSSVEAVFVDVEFDGELLTSSSWNARSKIQDQLLYTVGQLNGENSVGRLDQLDLTDIRTESVDGMTRVSYHARLPVAWGKPNRVPSSYTFVMPIDVSFQGQADFTEKYKDKCVDWSAHDVDSGSMWYYYRTQSSRCKPAAEDVIEVEASVTLSSISTTGKYPEYDMVWEDDALRVVAVFGKYEDDATSNGDAGISAYNRFTRKMKDTLRRHDLVTTPAEIPYSPGVDMPETIFEATLADGKTVIVTALLIDGVRSAGADFDSRYGELSGTADLIAYNGHSGLGANIRALARKGEWQRGQYVIVFMNGCDTYAYVDDALATAHSNVNPDDPNGTKYMDIVTNAMPSYFRSTANATTALIEGLLSYDEPYTYEKMFANIDRAQVVLVSGEQDNVFVPGGGGGEPERWEGIDSSGSVVADEEIRFSTPTLDVGRYRFEISGAGDADLYVRVGTEPSFSLFDCRPYKGSSNEICSIELSAPAAIHVMVRGWASSSTFHLVGNKE